MKRSLSTLLVAMLVAAGGALLSACGSTALSASSTCQDFMKASPTAQQQVISQLASQYHKPSYATPLGEPEVPYYCADNPNVTLGDFFSHASTT
ncbi:MAG: hypothetical protein ACRDZR_01010 [Acidimicrobiales bacterium]